MAAVLFYFKKRAGESVDYPRVITYVICYTTINTGQTTAVAISKLLEDLPLLPDNLSTLPMTGKSELSKKGCMPKTQNLSFDTPSRFGENQVQLQPTEPLWP
jgi:hypothetical protein